MRKTPKKEFDKFKAEAIKWIELLGMGEWDIGIALVELPTELYARSETSAKTMRAQLLLNKITHGLDCYEGYELDAARHEVFHVLHGHVERIASSRWASQGQLYDALERMVISLERATHGL